MKGPPIVTESAALERLVVGVASDSEIAAGRAALSLRITSATASSTFSPSGVSMSSPDANNTSPGRANDHAIASNFDLQAELGQLLQLVTQDLEALLDARSSWAARS